MPLSLNIWVVLYPLFCWSTQVDPFLVHCKKCFYLTSSGYMHSSGIPASQVSFWFCEDHPDFHNFAKIHFAHSTWCFPFPCILVTFYFYMDRKVLSFEITWINMEKIMESEISKTQRDGYYRISVKCTIIKYQA